jgi:hypothetical protein
MITQKAAFQGTHTQETHEITRPISVEFVSLAVSHLYFGDHTWLGFYAATFNFFAALANSRVAWMFVQKRVPGQILGRARAPLLRALTAVHA